MDKDRIAQNLTCVDGHFHNEAENDVEAALELYTDDIIFRSGRSQWPQSFFFRKADGSQVLS